MLQRRTTQANELVISYLLLRKFVGWIGMLLPFVLLIGNAVMSEARPDSMSGYYYTPMRNFFVGALCALGVFLIAYDGYDNVDRWITNIAGLCAIGVAFCPTKPSGQLATWQNVVGDIHVVFAVCTFTALGLMALRFAKDGQTPASQAPSASAARLEIINKPSATQNGGYGAEARSWRVMVARLRSRGRVCALSHVRGARRRAQAR